MTLSTEAAALHAVIEEDFDRARELIAGMLPKERWALANQAHQLAELIDERDRLMAVVHSRCRWYRNCPHAIVGYYTARGSHYGICALHVPAARKADVTVHDLPKEVQL